MTNLYAITCRIQRMMFFCIATLFSSILSAEQKPYAPETIQNVTVVIAEQVIDMILADPELIVIDSRKKSEYTKGHIEGAINLLNTRLQRSDLEQLTLEKSRAMLFYCNGLRCLRSSDAIKKAQSWGYTNLIWFRGGWKEWTEKRLPVITE